VACARRRTISAGWLVPASKATYSGGRSIHMSVVINSPHAGTSLGAGAAGSERAAPDRAGPGLAPRPRKAISPEPIAPAGQHQADAQDDEDPGMDGKGGPPRAAPEAGALIFLTCVDLCRERPVARPEVSARRLQEAWAGFNLILLDRVADALGIKLTAKRRGTINAANPAQDASRAGRCGRLDQQTETTKSKATKWKTQHIDGGKWRPSFRDLWDWPSSS